MSTLALSCCHLLTMQPWSDVMAGPAADQVKMKKDTVRDRGSVPTPQILCTTEPVLVLGLCYWA
jgi:hypothetical protein